MTLAEQQASGLPRMIRGTVVTQRRRCGKPNCHCADGQVAVRAEVSGAEVPDSAGQGMGREALDREGEGAPLVCELPNCLVLSHFPERRDKPAWRRRWKSSTSKG